MCGWCFTHAIDAHTGRLAGGDAGLFAAHSEKGVHFQAAEAGADEKGEGAAAKGKLSVRAPGAGIASSQQYPQWVEHTRPTSNTS